MPVHANEDGTFTVTLTEAQFKRVYRAIDKDVDISAPQEDIDLWGDFRDAYKANYRRNLERQKAEAE